MARNSLAIAKSENEAQKDVFDPQRSAATATRREVTKLVIERYWQIRRDWEAYETAERQWESADHPDNEVQRRLNGLSDSLSDALVTLLEGAQKAVVHVIYMHDPRFYSAGCAGFSDSPYRDSAMEWDGFLYIAQTDQTKITPKGATLRVIELDAVARPA